jgi:hypothetical protein
MKDGNIEVEEELERLFSNSRLIPRTDHIVDSVVDKFVERAQFGREKYGVGLDREDLTFPNYVTHLREELMDGILYLQKIETLHTEILLDIKSLKDSAIKMQSYEMAASLRGIERKLQEFKI